jgi:hypothetical protein
MSRTTGTGKASRLISSSHFAARPSPRQEGKRVPFWRRSKKQRVVRELRRCDILRPQVPTWGRAAEQVRSLLDKHQPVHAPCLAERRKLASSFAEAARVHQQNLHKCVEHSSGIVGPCGHSNTASRRESGLA